MRGADRSRRPLDAKQHVAATLQRALAEGNRSAATIDGMRRLRAELGARPLDSGSRVQYAALLLSMTRRLDDTRAAAFHARSAAGLAPVTLPVVELAARILARSGDHGESLDLARSVFAYDPAAAAALLLRLEGSVPAAEFDRGLADLPQAWCAWSQQLTESGRDAESWALLRRASERWPQELEILVRLARRALLRADWDALDRWTTRVEPIPPRGHGLQLLAFRARAHAEAGRGDEAREDLEILLGAGGDRPYLLTLAGAVYERLGSAEEARDAWNRALFQIGLSRPRMRIDLLVRLARLEQEQGRASVALRHWREILEIEPDHARARRRVDELTGVR